LTALGIDASGQRHILGFMLGDRENLDSWNAFLDDLLSRGLPPSSLRLVISDEHKGIEAAVSSRLACPHQLCLVHKLRNLRLRVPSPDRKAFMADLHAIFWALDRETARQALGRFEARWGKAYPKAVSLSLSTNLNITHVSSLNQKNFGRSYGPTIFSNVSTVSCAAVCVQLARCTQNWRCSN
jgi:transposase-like protein